jgi:hypothetical protein
MSEPDRCVAVFRHRCTLRQGHGGPHESGDSAELLESVDTMQGALDDAIRFIEYEHPGMSSDLNTILGQLKRARNAGMGGKPGGKNDR